MNQASADHSKRLDIYARKGDTFNLDLIVKDFDESPFDFTGYSATLEVFTSPSDLTPKFSFVVSGGLTLTAGNINLYKSASDMALIRRRDYTYLLRVTYPDDSIMLWLNGAFIINEGRFNGVDNDVEKFINNMIIIQINGATGGVTTSPAFRGDCDLSTNLYPENGTAGVTGSGTGGAILMGDWWYSTDATDLLSYGNPIPIGSTITARVNNPSNNNGNDWIAAYTIRS